MTPAPANSRVAVATLVPALAGALAILVGGVVILGWALDIAALKSVLPIWVSMKPNTAVAFILIGLAVLFSRPPSTFRLGPLLSRLGGGLAGLIGLLSLAEYTFNWNPGFDQWLFPEPARAVGTSHPGRMAPDTAICFALLAVGWAFASRVRESTSLRIAPLILGALVTTIGLVEILSYFSPALRTYGWGGLTMMALPTAILFTALGAALVGSAVPRKSSAPTGSAQPFARADNATPIKFLFIFAALAIGIIAAGTFYYGSIERKFINEVSNQLSAIADLKVNQLTQWRRERLGDASLLLRNRAFTGLVRRYLTQPADADAQQQLQVWLGKYRGTLGYDQVRLMDAAGVSRLTIPAGRPSFSDFILQRSLATLRSGRMDLVDFYRSASDGRNYLALLVPVFDEANASQPLGVLVLRIDPTRYLYPSIQGWPVPSRTAETLLVRREGNEVVYLNDLRFRPHAALELRVPLAGRDLPAARAILGERGFIEGTDYRGVPVLSALREIPDSSWFLVAKLDREEAYAPIRGQLLEVFAAVVGFLVAAGAGVGLVWREQRGRFYQQQMKVAEELRASEFRYRRLFEATKDGILILEAETGMVLDVNPFLIELLGFSHEEFLGKKVWELGFFKDVVANQANFAELQQKEYIRYENMALETKTGRRIEVEFTSNVYLVNHQKVMQCDIRDITVRKQAAEALAAEKQNLEAVFASSPVAMFILDETTQIVRVNAAAITLSGASSAEVLEHRPGNALGCKHSMEDPRGCGYSTACRVCATRNGLESVLANGGALKGLELQFELVRHGKIEKVWMAVGAEPIQINGRRHLIVAMDDITARKQAKERILQLNAELERRVADRTAELAAANKELEAFSYSVSHDLRAPLRSIDGFSRIVLEDYAAKLDDEGRDSLNRIRAGAQRLGQLIDDMLNLSRVGRAELRREPVDVGALAREVALDLRQQEPARAVELTVADDLTAEADPRLLRIVLVNLLGNAWKFTGKCVAPRIEVGAMPGTKPATYFVKDNGAGFDEAYAGKLFGAFQRLHTKEQFSGTGIGLATVQRIIHRHGGRVWAEAKVGEGATFYFTLEGSTSGVHGSTVQGSKVESS